VTASDPWAPYRSSEVAEARSGRVLCGFHSRHPDVGEDYDDPDPTDAVDRETDW
jgi:hypothetical protein